MLHHKTRPYCHFILFFAVTFSFALLSSAADAKNTKDNGNIAIENSKKQPKKWQSYLENSGQFGNGRAIGLIDLFLIIKQKPNSILFTDIRGQLDDNSSNEYNIGLGYRRLFEHSIIGTYLYCDRRKSSYDNIFHQLTLGIEKLGKKWDFRFNAYIPQDKEGAAGANAFIEDNRLKVSYQSEKPLKGVDFEIGRKIPLGNSRAYLGYYYFAKDNDKGFTYAKKSAAKIRLETKLFNDFITLGGEFAYDQNSNRNETAYLRVKIPFGTKASQTLTELEKRMTDTVIRDIDIVTNQYIDTTSDVTLAINNISPDNAYIVDLSTIDDIDDTIESYGNNSLVILTNSGTLNDEINLADGQVLLSGSSSLALSYITSRGNRLHTNYNPGMTTATINAGADVSNYDCNVGLGASDCLILIDNNNAALKGINIDGGKEAIYITGNNLTNINLVNLNITNSSNNAVYIHNSNNGIINMTNIAINNIGNDAIYIRNSDNNKINIINSTISNITNDGIDITSGSGDNEINITNTNFNNITAIPINNKNNSDTNIINVN